MSTYRGEEGVKSCDKGRVDVCMVGRVPGRQENCGGYWRQEKGRERLGLGNGGN